MRNEPKTILVLPSEANLRELKIRKTMVQISHRSS